MGTCYVIANLDRREILNPHCIKHGGKWDRGEFSGHENGVLDALAHMIGPIDFLSPWCGHWRGQRIAIIADHESLDERIDEDIDPCPDLPPEPHEGDRWRDVTVAVVAAMTAPEPRCDTVPDPPGSADWLEISLDVGTQGWRRMTDEDREYQELRTIAAGDSWHQSNRVTATTVQLQSILDATAWKQPRTGWGLYGKPHALAAGCIATIGDGIISADTVAACGEVFLRGEPVLPEVYGADAMRCPDCNAALMPKGVL
jgi:hypothetical protein